MNLHAGAVEAEAFDPDADQPMLLQRGEHPVQNTRLGPATQARVDRVPVAERRRQGAPFAAVLRHIQHRVNHRQVGNPYIPPLNRQIGTDQFILRFAYSIHSNTLEEMKHQV